MKLANQFHKVVRNSRRHKKFSIFITYSHIFKPEKGSLKDFQSKNLFQLLLNISQDVLTNLCQLTLFDRGLENELTLYFTTSLLHDGREPGPINGTTRPNCHITSVFSSQKPTDLLLPIRNHSQSFHPRGMSERTVLPTPFSTYYSWIRHNI